MKEELDSLDNSIRNDMAKRRADLALLRSYGQNELSLKDVLDL